MSKRDELESEIKNKLAEIKVLEGKIAELRKETLLLSDEKQQFKEEIEIHTKKGVTEKLLVGRIYWIENFKDQDADAFFPVERSKVVRINGEWI